MPGKAGGCLRTACLAPFLLAAVQAVAAPVSLITGYCYTDRIDKPLAGALIALYGTDNLLLSSTYSTNSGSFTLPAPDTPGKYFLVATAGSKSQRVNLEIQSGRPTGLVQIVFHEGGSWLGDVWKFVTGKLDYMITFFLGAGLGLMSKYWDNRRVFKLSRVRMLAARGEITTEVAAMNTALTAWLETSPGASERPGLQAQWQEHIDKMKAALSELDAARPDVTVVFGVKGEAGLDQSRRLKTTIEQIRLLPEQIEQVGKLPEDQRQAKMGPFSDLAANALFKA